MDVAPRLQPQSIPASHRLPHELLEYIINLTLLDDAPLKSLDQFSLYPRVVPKCNFAYLRGFSQSSRTYHAVVQKAWYRVLYVREKNDWEVIARLGITGYVREIRVLSPALGRGVSPDMLMQFSKLHTAVIDAHRDFELNSLADTTRGASPVGQYYNVVSRLPSSLRRIHIVNAHGPDISIIQTLRSHCQHVEELSISRCTLFSPRLRLSTPTIELCGFWNTFPKDHDSYFANEGVEDYAIALSNELKPLKFLQSLHMGLYLTPHAAISSHTQDHSVCKSAEGSIWAQKCPKCSEEYESETTAAEKLANEMLFRELPQLRTISWASFFSADRQDAVCYDRVHETSARVD